MKKDDICMYKVEIKDSVRNATTFLGKEYSGLAGVGKITQDNLFEKIVQPFARSLEHGGVNAHVSRELGYIPYPSSVKVTVQKGSRSGQVFEWKAPAFMAW